MDTTDIVIIVAAVSTGLMAGLVFPFSIGLLSSLHSIPHVHGIQAMQRMNTRIQNPIFGIVFLGAALSSLTLVILRFATERNVPSLAPIGGALYLVGFLLVTISVNIPLNNRLDRLDPLSAEASGFWDRFVTAWSIANHVRFVAASAACTLIVTSAAGG